MKNFCYFTYFAKPSKAALRTFEDGAFFNILKYIVNTTFITSVKFFCLLSLFSSALVSSNSFSTSSNFFDRWKYNFDLNSEYLNHKFNTWSNNLKQGLSTSGCIKPVRGVHSRSPLYPFYFYPIHTHAYLPKKGESGYAKCLFY